MITMIYLKKKKIIMIEEKYRIGCCLVFYLLIIFSIPEKSEPGHTHNYIFFFICIYIVMLICVVEKGIGVVTKIYMRYILNARKT